MAVHDEQGIVAGRWPDIAERAGVSLATVYRHFPNLEELVTACGRLTMELVDPPTPESSVDAYRGARTREERIERLVAGTHAFYERAGRVVDNVRRDRRRLPVLEEAHQRLEEGLAALVEEAFRPLGGTRDDVRLALALLDVRTWEAMRDHGLSRVEAADTTRRILLCALPERATEPGAGPSGETRRDPAPASEPGLS